MYVLPVEGFMDYLHSLLIRVENNPQHPRLDTQDYIILNRFQSCESGKLIGNLHPNRLFFDNDTAGREHLQEVKEKFGERMLDKSMYYRDYMT